MFLRNFVAQLLICVIFEDNKHAVRARSIRGDKVVKTYEKSFEDKKKLLQYVDNLSQNFQIYYIGAFFDASEQALAPVLGASELGKFGIDSKQTQSLTLLNAQICAPKPSVREYKRLFEDYGELDLLFSPFMLLYHCINTKTKLKKDKNTLFVFRHSIYLALMICENKRISFGKFYDLSTQNIVNLDEDSISLDEMPDAEVGEEVAGLIREDASENAPQNAPANADEAAQNAPDERYIANSAMDLSNFGSDMDMCSCIFGGVQEFYTNSLYEAKFIDEVVFFDNSDISQAVLDYIEGEIFIKPEVVKIDTFNLMNELMRKELEI